MGWGPRKKKQDNVGMRLTDITSSSITSHYLGIEPASPVGRKTGSEGAVEIKKHSFHHVANSSMAVLILIGLLVIFK